MQIYAGTNPERQSVGLPGHCDRCAKESHEVAHPNLGCSDVGCTSAHREPPRRALTYVLQVPAGARRVWRSRLEGGLVVRDLSVGMGTDFYPVGYVSAGVVIPEAVDSLSDREVTFLDVNFASHPSARPVAADVPTKEPLGARCTRCMQSSGLPHLTSCRHFGLEVGDRVR